jgi:hydrogenase maturation factor
VKETPLETGKLPPQLLRELLDGAPTLPEAVRIGPAVGEDACAITVERGEIVVATDPITLTGRGVGAHAVQINANDVAVMGVRPRYFLCALLLPVGTTAAELRALFADMNRALVDLEAVLVGGHTEVTNAVSRPVVVGQMIGVAAAGAALSSGDVRPGDVMLQVGPAPVEGAAVLAAEAALEGAAVPADLLERARVALDDPGISIVQPALLLAAAGARALHDPTEGGLSAGLHELAEASGVRLELREAAVLWFEPGTALCEAVGADPWGTLASGTLLAAVPPNLVDQALATLDARGHPAAVIGQALEGSGVRLSTGRELPRFDRDELSRILS